MSEQVLLSAFSDKGDETGLNKLNILHYLYILSAGALILVPILLRQKAQR
jgi:hypothetical protein